MKKIALLLVVLISTFFLIACGKDASDYIRFVEGDSLDHVSGRIFLTQKINDETLTWKTDDTNIIDLSNINNVKISRPAVGASNIKVKLTAEHGSKKVEFSLTIIALTGNFVYDEYPSLRTRNHIIEVIGYEDLLVVLEKKESALIYFGFKECPYCQEYLPYFEAKARELLYEDKIFYYDFTDIRKVIEVDGTKVLDPSFQRIIDLIGTQHIEPTKDGLPWLFAPTFIGLGDNAVQGLFTGSVMVEGEDEAHNASRSALSYTQRTELETLISEILLNVIDCEC